MKTTSERGAHLSDADVLAGAVDGASAEATAHLITCERCRQAVQAWRQVLQAPAATEAPFVLERARRELDAHLDAFAQAQARAWRPTRVVAAVAAAACVGALVAVVGQGATGATTRAAPPVVPATPIAFAVNVSSAPDAPPPPPEPLPTLVPLAPQAAPPPPRTWQQTGDERAARGDITNAARIFATALAQHPEAGASLQALAASGPPAAELVDDALRSAGHAEAQRLLCERGLLLLRDATAVDRCLAFVTAHPQHPAAQLLAFAAGRVAEDKVGDCRRAVALFDRAAVLSPVSGLASAEAILGRARCRHALGEDAAAAADLRLYLSEPAGVAHAPAVQALAAELGVVVP